MKYKTTIAALLAAAGIATAGGLAWAKDTGVNDAVAALASAKITLEQAVAAAQQHHAGGKATKVELETEKGATFYEIEIVAADHQVFDVKVDAVDGKVLSSVLDKQDERKGDEKDD